MSGECDHCGEHTLECRCTPEDIQKSKLKQLNLYLKDFIEDKISLEELKEIAEDFKI